MGTNTSQEDQQPLLQDSDDEIPPIFEELKLVLIGSKGAGKNTVGNAILKENVFSFWTSYKCNHIMKTRKVSGRKIHLTRTPGWKGDLSRSNTTKIEIIHSVQSLYVTGPHAVLLALKVNSVFSDTTIETLEKLLSVQLWAHTIVLFTNGEKLGRYTIEDYIRFQQLQPLINRCGQRYFVIKKNNCNDIIETIEELIARKNSTRFFQLSAQEEYEATTEKLLSDWNLLVQRIKSKITSISTYNQNLKQERANDAITNIIKSKDAEIERLNKIVKEKEKEIKRLKSNQDELDPSFLRRKVIELEKQLEEKDKENDALRKQIKCERSAIEWRSHEGQAKIHADYNYQLRQTVEHESVNRHPQIKLQDLSKGPVQDNWAKSLYKILEELDDAQLKTMKGYMQWSKELPRGVMEGKDRVELVDLIIQYWGESASVLKIRDMMKEIQRNDDVIKNLLKPFLNEMGETW